MQFNFSSPDELALCQFAASMGFTFVSRSKEGCTLRVDKHGYGDGRIEVELYQQLGVLDFNSKRKRVTCVYLRDGLVHVMCKGADGNVLPLLYNPNVVTSPDRELSAAAEPSKREALEAQLSDMAAKGLRTLVVAGSTRPAEWWWGADGNPGMSAVYKAINLPDRGSEKGHSKGECRSECRACAGLLHMERAAHLRLVGLTAVEDRLQELVPEAIADFLQAGIKIWMLTGDKRETAKNIGLACNLIDPEMESQTDLLGSLSVDDMNRVVEITGDWVSMCNNTEQLRQMFDILDCGGDVVDGYRTSYISRDELRLFLIGLRVPGMSDDRTFDAHWALVATRADGRIAFPEFVRFIKNLRPSHLKAVQTDLELGLRKARLIAGDGTEEEKRERLERTPISLVVEGEAVSVFFPDKARGSAAAAADGGHGHGHGHGRGQSAASRLWGGRSRSRDGHDEDEGLEPEALLLRETFLELAAMSKSVICCRLTPAQKGRIVEEFKKRGKITLAIGDGANDELMIRRASIGVGIAGLEGTASSRAADYSIVQFRFLHTLLFVHGWWCYRRISKLVLFIFHKAAMVALSMYIFGWYSAFSGQQFFNDAIYILYNVAFTAVPILALAVFDQGGLSRATLENDPRAYLSIAHKHFFHDSVFLSWLLRAVWNSLWIFGCCFFVVGLGDVSGEAGRNHGIWLLSTTVYTAVVLLVTMRILFECQSINIYVLGAVLLSFFGYFPVVLLANAMPSINPNLSGVYGLVFHNVLVWALLIMCVSVPLLVDAFSWGWRRHVSPTYVNVLQERQRLSKAELLRLDQGSVFAGNMQASSRVRARNVPHVSQAQRDDQLLAKIRRALQLQQSQQEAAKEADTSGETAQRRAEALVYTMTRLQNLSGSNFDATPQRNILSLYEVRDNLSAAQLAAIKEREAAIAKETAQQHQVQLLKQAQAQRQREEAAQRRGQGGRDADPEEERGRGHLQQHVQTQRKLRAARRSSDGGSANAHELVYQLSPDEDEDDEEADSDVEREISAAAAAADSVSVAAGGGTGRAHLAGDHLDDVELSISDNAIDHDGAEFNFADERKGARR